MKTKRELNTAYQALTLIDSRVQRGLHGSVEGIDTVDVGLDKMAVALARLFDFPQVEHDDAPGLEQVLAYLAADGKIEEEACLSAAHVKDGIRQATYHGLNDRSIEETERARTSLYEHLEALLTQVERDMEASDG